MTDTQLEQIREMRQENYSYRFIGDTLGLSMNTVKSICRRSGIVATGPRKTKAEKMSVTYCKNCHKLLNPDPFHPRLFCSTKCRRDWHRHHQNALDSSSLQSD